MKNIAFFIIFLPYCIFALTKEEYKHLELFSKVLSLIEENYVEPVKETKLIYGAIRGMMEELDPHSQHYPPEAYGEMKQDTAGTFGGLGIEITTRDNDLTIVAPIDGSPAHKAGIKPGDKIVKIGEKFTKDLSIYECIQKLKGKIGTKITIYVKREGVKKLLKFVIKRQRIREKSVNLKNLGNKIAYFRISQFQERTAADFKKLFYKFKKENKNIAGVIIDLRINPGGILNQAVEIVDMFIDKGEIVSIVMRDPEAGKIFKATAVNTFKDFPMAILIDEGSASASEIVAGALQDHKRAVLIGTKTFGKGTVQNVIDLSDGSGLKLTIAHYYTPSGRSFQSVGIAPNIVVKLDENKVSSKGKKKTKLTETEKLIESDNQLKRAVEYIKSSKQSKKKDKKILNKK